MTVPAARRAPFVTQLRAGRKPLTLAQPGADAIRLRVEAAELWDTLPITARSDTRVGDLKQAVVERLYPRHQFAEDFMLKFRGWEILDERSTLRDAGLIDGSILLLAYRRRRPVR